MTAEKIREKANLQYGVGNEEAAAMFEIAAQLAELNELLRNITDWKTGRLGVHVVSE